MPAAAAASSLSGTTIEAVALELPKKTEMSQEMKETKKSGQAAKIFNEGAHESADESTVPSDAPIQDELTYVFDGHI